MVLLPYWALDREPVQVISVHPSLVSRPHPFVPQTMPTVFTHEFNTFVYKGKVSFNTGLFIDGKVVDGSDKITIKCVPH